MSNDWVLASLYHVFLFSDGIDEGLALTFSRYYRGFDEFLECDIGVVIRSRFDVSNHYPLHSKRESTL